MIIYTVKTKQKVFKFTNHREMIEKIVLLCDDVLFVSGGVHTDFKEKR